MTLDPQMATKVFLEMTVLLGKLRGITRFILMSPNNLTYDEPIRDYPPFDQPGSPYSSVDDELIARAAILRNNLTRGQLAAVKTPSRMRGPLSPLSWQTWYWSMMSFMPVGASQAGGLT